MARKRFIKPGFFKNEELAELKCDVRILFIGLWCWADREGRLEDRPKRIKADIMPYDTINIDKALTLLMQKGFILRYEAKNDNNSINIIQIINFSSHQDVHVNEQVSILPAPCKNGAKTVQVPNNNGGSTPFNLEPLTSTINLEEVVVDKAQARKNEIEEAIKDCERDNTGNVSYPPEAHLSEEKEKSSAKKEKVLPTLEEAIEKISQTTNWWNVIEFHLATELVAKYPKIAFVDMPEAEKQPLYDRRAEMFKKFYATKQDTYKVRMQSWNEIAQNFYYWVPTELNRENLQKLNSHAINRAKNGTNGFAKNNTTGERISRNNSIENLIEKSESFLQQSHGDE